jgi:hypothetical protein
MEPNLYLRWFECHPGLGTWVQGIGTLLAICVAIFIPLGIHLSERLAAQKPRLRAINRVLGALEMIKANAKALRRAEAKYNAVIDEEGHTRLDDINCTEVGAAMLAAYRNISDAGELLPEFVAQAEIESAQAIQSLNAVISVLNSNETAIANEMRWLARKVTRPVVQNSLGTGAYIADELLGPISAAIVLLRPEI